MHKHCRFRAGGFFKLVEVRKKAKIRNLYNQVSLILIAIRSEYTSWQFRNGLRFSFEARPCYKKCIVFLALPILEISFKKSPFSFEVARI